MLFDRYQKYFNKNVAFKVAFIYALLGGLWILTSDWVVGRIVANLQQSVEISIFKGIVFILLTSLLIFGLISFYMKRINDYVESKIRAEKEVQRKNAQLQVLNHASRDINSVLEVPEIMRKLVCYAFDLTGATSGTAGIMLNGRMVFTEYNENGRFFPISLTFEENLGVPGHVMATHESYLTNDATNDAYVIPEIQKKFKFTSLLDTPIIDKNGRLAGCFEIHNKPEGFNSEDKELMESLATVAAIALENAGILEEYRKVQTALQESEERFRVALDRAPFPMAIHSSDGKMVHINEAWSRISGYAFEEIPTISAWAEKAYGRNKDSMVKVISSYYQKDSRVQDGEYVINTKYGASRIWSFDRADLGNLPDGKGLVLTVAADLTDIRNAEYKLRQQQEEQLDIFNSVPALIFFKNLKNEFIWVNDTADKWFTCPKGDLVNRPLSEVFPGEGEGYYDSDKTVIETQKPVRDVVEQMTTREGKRWIKVDKIPFKDEKGEIKGIIGIASDITNLKEAEEELIKAKEKAQEADRL
ncbi:MAG: PAS domain S-box protein, partial [Acidobacteriota bacterium]